MSGKTNRPQGSDISTYTGKYVDVFNPHVDDIDIIDIAHALSLTCRWGGQCSYFYSVAQHSVPVSKALPDELKLQGLLHDASEAYLGDLPRPIKQVIPEYKEVENRLLSVIFEKYKVPYPIANEVHEIDAYMLYNEANILMPDHGWSNSKCNAFDANIRPSPPAGVEQWFLMEFDDLMEIANNARI